METTTYVFVEIWVCHANQPCSPGPSCRASSVCYIPLVPIIALEQKGKAWEKATNLTVELALFRMPFRLVWYVRNTAVRSIHTVYGALHTYLLRTVSRGSSATWVKVDIQFGTSIWIKTRCKLARGVISDEAGRGKCNGDLYPESPLLLQNYEASRIV